MEYQHVQKGLFVIPTAALFAFMGAMSLVDDDGVAPTMAMIGLANLVLGVVLVFSRLEVTVTDDEISAAFGFGRPRKVIKLNDVSEVRQVRNPWYYGWGLRKIRRGWMYNVWGLDAVELKLSSGKVFRVGTDDPEGLLSALSQRGVRAGAN